MGTTYRIVNECIGDYALVEMAVASQSAAIHFAEKPAYQQLPLLPVAHNPTAIGGKQVRTEQLTQYVVVI